MTDLPYPLLFHPILLEKVWGSDRLARFGKPVRPGAKVGESWEVADLAATSASGAGGAAARSVIANGPLAGRPLGEAIALWGPALLGSARSAAGNFPLLVKYLDAGENLSVQVHPSAAWASTHAGAHLKTECWYILDAAAGSVLYKGLRPGVTRERLAALARAGDRAIVECLATVPAVPGECHNLPSGTVHALGAGVLVAEVQTPSDTTFRLYDWGRTDRQLHIEEALACAEIGPAPAAARFRAGPWSRLVSTEYFALDESRPAAGEPLSLATGGRCCVLMAVAGRGVLHAAGCEPLALGPGSTLVVPAALVNACAVRGQTSMTLIRAMLP